jgi:hypothetical protein
MKELNLNKIDLHDKKDQHYYTTEDIVIPKGTRIENWSIQQKQDGNRFEMIVGFGADYAYILSIYPDELEEIIKCNPNLFSHEQNNK